MAKSVWWIVAAASGALAIAAGVFVVRHDWAVEELMEKIHVGEDSPWTLVKREAAAESPDWERALGPSNGFVEMAKALEGAKHPDIRASADGYSSAAVGLVEAVKRHDAEAFRESVRGLERSCGDCHFDGGVGGALSRE